jgi:hypothetical protein
MSTLGRRRNATPVLLLATIAIALHASWVSAELGLQVSLYIVTAEPIRVHTGPGDLCIAIDPSDQAGIWWWGPGRSGCLSRNTTPGPGQESAKGLAALFHADRATVSEDSSGTVHASFRLGLHGPPEFVDIELTAHAGRIRCTQTGAEVSTKRLGVLDIPFEPR